ncbi:hypothetical protein Cva_00290 [Caedimonas varicaedens]|uniref:Uncharacterized protein n=1 Tax=Caedimonas varicaedens TaxID=1629334 RepID=A0A0K8MCN7_9PROT|nr:hypothetical protein Cva_00290 [Caedimonas varicaedens]
MTQLRLYLNSLTPVVCEEVVRFETEPGAQMQMDWIEFRKGKTLYPLLSQPLVIVGSAMSALWRMRNYRHYFNAMKMHLIILAVSPLKPFMTI